MLSEQYWKSKMYKLDVKVTKIGRRWHARLLKGEVVLDELGLWPELHDMKEVKLWIDVACQEILAQFEQDTKVNKLKDE